MGPHTITAAGIQVFKDHHSLPTSSSSQNTAFKGHHSLSTSSSSQNTVTRFLTTGDLPEASTCKMLQLKCSQQVKMWRLAMMATQNHLPHTVTPLWTPATATPLSTLATGSDLHPPIPITSLQPDTPPTSPIPQSPTPPVPVLISSAATLLPLTISTGNVMFQLVLVSCPQPQDGTTPEEHGKMEANQIRVILLNGGVN